MSQATDRERSEAYVTLATNDSYSIGALVLGQSLRNSNTKRHLVVMVTNQVTGQMREQLRGMFDSVTVVDVLDSRDTVNLNLLARPDLGQTFTKLHCWRLTQFNKCVFLDADTLVLHNIDELFDYEELAAAPDVGWPDCFNSGVFVYQPSLETYASLSNLALTKGSFDGGDQGLLNQYFSDWSTQGRSRRLPFIYNAVAQAFYSYSPAYKQYGHNVKVIHFIGSVKPWNIDYNRATRTLEGGPYQATDFLQRWWNLFIDQVHHHLSDPLKASFGTGSSVSYPSEDGSGHTGGGYSQQQLDDGHRQYDWERGHIDYMGVDSFDNIKRQLDTKIQPMAASLTTGSAPLTRPSNGLPEGPPAAKSRVLQALENQFREGSEFRKSSTDLVSPAAPRQSVHRATVVLTPKAYREQVINKVAAAPTSTASKAAGPGTSPAAANGVKPSRPTGATPAAAAAKPITADVISLKGMEAAQDFQQTQQAATDAKVTATAATKVEQSPVQSAQASPASPTKPISPITPIKDAGVLQTAGSPISPQGSVSSSAAPLEPISHVSPTKVQEFQSSTGSSTIVSPTTPIKSPISPTGASKSPIVGATQQPSSPQAQISPTGASIGGFIQGQGQGGFGEAGLSTYVDYGYAGYSADAPFGSDPAPLAFSTPAPGGYQQGLQQPPSKPSPVSSPSSDPWSSPQESFGSPSGNTQFFTANPYQTPTGADPLAHQGFKQGGVSISGPGGFAGSVQVTPTKPEVEFGQGAEEQQHQQRGKRGGRKSKQ